MGILFGLAAALFWGSGDFLITRVTRQTGLRWGLLLIQLTGLVLILSLIVLNNDWPQVASSVWWYAVVVSLLNVIGTLALYRAFTVGVVAIVSPISAGFAAVTAVLGLLTGESPAPLTLVGVAVVILGVIVVSTAPTDGKISLAGVPEALIAALAYGFYFWLLSDISAQIGVAWPVLLGRVAAVAAALVLLVAGRASLRRLPLDRRLLLMTLAASLLDTAAFLAYNTGVRSGSYVSVITALASIFSAVTVLLAWFVLKERLTRSQWAGVAGVLTGVLLVSV
jgi:drug/metabolite transporter (DMT)-like permease